MNVALLKELAEAPGIPGREERVRDIVRREMKGLVDSVTTDAMGNVIGRKGSGGPRVMLAAHMDEIGFFVRHVEDKGFLRLQTVGGFDARQLFAQRVLVHTRKGESLRGVLTYATKPTHLLSDSERNKSPEITEFFVDVGMGADAVKERVSVGDMVTMDRTLEEVGDCLISKSMDNRVSVFVMLEALRKAGPLSCEVAAVATVQEEVGLRGAQTAAFSVDPAIGIALDTTIAADHPGGTDAEAVTRIGQGTAIKIMDSSIISHPKLIDHMRSLAEGAGIPHQMEILPRGGTDGGTLQRARGGNVCMTLSVPTRYVHTVNEMIHRKDLQATIDLLALYLEHAPEGDYAL